MSLDKLIKFFNEFNIVKCFKTNLSSFIQICYVHFFQTSSLINMNFFKVIVFNNSNTSYPLWRTCIQSRSLDIRYANFKLCCLILITWHLSTCYKTLSRHISNNCNKNLTCRSFCFSSNTNIFKYLSFHYSIMKLQYLLFFQMNIILRLGQKGKKPKLPTSFWKVKVFLYFIKIKEFAFGTFFFITKTCFAKVMKISRNLQINNWLMYIIISNLYSSKDENNNFVYPKRSLSSTHILKKTM